MRITKVELSTDQIKLGNVTTNLVKLPKLEYLVTLHSKDYLGENEEELGDYKKYDIGWLPKKLPEHALAFLVFKQTMLPDQNYYGVIDTTMVAKAYRHSGIGKILYNAALEFAKKNKMKGISSEWGGRSEEAESFWAKYGQGNLKTERMRESNPGYALITKPLR